MPGRLTDACHPCHPPQSPRRTRVKLQTPVILLATALVATACADLGRSRDLANPAVAPATLAQQVCANCHGPRGVSVSPNFPNLAAQTEPYIVAQLTGFRAHERTDPPGFEYMWGISRSLSDDQIKGLAAYYSAQPPAPAQPIDEADRAAAAAGQAIFTHGLPAQSVPACMSCHGPGGAGNGGFPRLAGQHADYLRKQLLVFQRTNERPEGTVMKVVAHSLSPANIRDVAAYLQSLGSP
ncbi:MAG: cytochrome c4 [Burkholderiales bacterium]|nr:cytochrome c4 [Burkholderiales bacterium]